MKQKTDQIGLFFLHTSAAKLNFIFLFVARKWFNVKIKNHK